VAGLRGKYRNLKHAKNGKCLSQQKRIKLGFRLLLIKDIVVANMGWNKEKLIYDP